MIRPCVDETEATIFIRQRCTASSPRYLRHADIHITSASYADKKKIITPKTFAGLLQNPASSSNVTSSVLLKNPKNDQ